MRKIRIILLLILCAGLPAAAGFNTAAVRAEKEEEKISVLVSLISIEARIVDFGNEEDEEEDRDRVEFFGDFDEGLKKELIKLHKKMGYNSYRILKNALHTVTNREYTEYLIVNGLNYYVKNRIRGIKTWTDHEKKKHTVVTINGLMVKRTKVVDDEGREKTVDKKITSFKFSRELKDYFLLILEKFLKTKEGDKEVSTDLILVVSPVK